MRAKKIILAFSVLMVVMVLAGCAQLQGPSLSPTSSPKILIEYHRSGGFAGVSEDLTIYDNLQAVFRERNKESEFTLTKEKVDSLTKRLEEANFLTLQKEYVSERPGADFFEHRISYKGHTVKAIDATVPESLWPVLESLNGIIQSQKG